jgi:Protein of unknown function (DUF3309)
MGLIVLLVLILLLVGWIPGAPWWHAPHTWGWGPSGIAGVLVVVVLILLLTGRL